MKLLSALLLCTLSLFAAAEEHITVDLDGKTFYISKNNAASIENFIAEDIENPPNKNEIVFVGSSTIRLWKTLKQDMEPLPVLNRGFGGSRTWEMLTYVDALVLKHTPKLIVIFCGTNDTGTNYASPELSFNNCAKVVDALRTVQPDARIVYMLVTKAPAREKFWPKMDSINTLAQAYAEKHDYFTCFDTNQFVFNEDGTPKIELYRKDKLHLNEEGYAELTRLMRPLIESEWAEVNK